MELKFKHDWKNREDGKRTLTTTLDMSMEYCTSEQEIGMSSGDLKKYLEKCAEEMLRQSIYDLPRAEFYEALQDFLQHVMPFTSDPQGFSKTQKRLIELAGQLKK